MASYLHKCVTKLTQAITSTKLPEPSEPEPVYSPRLPPTLQLEPDDGSWQASILKGTTLSTLRERHSAQTTLLQTSKTHRKTLNIISKIFSQRRPLTISSCLCLGLGSLSGPVGRCCAGRCVRCENVKVMSQLVYFESWVRLLREHFEIPHVYLQDPGFNALDREFLAERGMEVIVSPASMEMLTEQSFLFAPHLEYVPLYVSLMKCFPAIYVGSCLEKTEDPERMTSEEWWVDMVRVFLERREAVGKVSFSAELEVTDRKRCVGSVYYLK